MQAGLRPINVTKFFPFWNVAVNGNAAGPARRQAEKDTGAMIIKLEN